MEIEKNTGIYASRNLGEFALTTQYVDSKDRKELLKIEDEISLQIINLMTTSFTNCGCDWCQDIMSPSCGRRRKLGKFGYNQLVEDVYSRKYSLGVGRK